jgi:hypothetical protein
MDKFDRDTYLIKAKRENDATVAAIRGLSDFDLLLLHSVLGASNHVSSSALRGKVADARAAILSPPSAPPPLSDEDRALIDEVYERLTTPTIHIK